MNEYQEKKIAELKGLGWTESGSQSFNGPGRSAPRVHVYSFTSSAGLVAYVYPNEVMHIPAALPPKADLLSESFQQLA
ncbi:hypothetical protein [Aquipseudomonas alcaligenes]|uniref:hypothetical protein n=1 Tax=Aquipseudomonas alcaligenes TaxID=43263 RepID=UPI001F1F1B5D|nr:hypothetical protein [Pseudomonas alcaligenes]BDC78289.1 hypothetical protein MRCP2_p0240 [Pseudomonas alcaligenes]